MLVVTKSTSIQKLSKHEQQPAVVSRLCCWQRAFNLPPCIFDVLRVSTCFRICQQTLPKYFSIGLRTIHLLRLRICSATPYLLLIQQNLRFFISAMVYSICALLRCQLLILIALWAYTHCIHLRYFLLLLLLSYKEYNINKQTTQCIKDSAVRESYGTTVQSAEIISLISDS